MFAKVIGQVALQPFRVSDPNNFSQLPPDEIDQFCELRRMAVDQAVQRQGVGKRLVDSLVEFARAHNFKKIHLGTGLHMYKAVHFYDSYGFRRSRVDKIPYESFFKQEISGIQRFTSVIEMDEEDQQKMLLPLEETRYLYRQYFELCL